MSVIFTRTGVPVPGMQAKAFEFAKRRAAAVNEVYGLQAEVYVRFGGALGEIVMVSKHDNLQELEDIKRKVIADSSSGRIPVAETGIFSKVEDAVWLTK